MPARMTRHLHVLSKVGGAPVAHFDLLHMTRDVISASVLSLAAILSIYCILDNDEDESTLIPY